MTYVMDGDGPGLVVDFIDHPEVAHPKAVTILFSHQLP
jgi:hypothetical protein